MTVHGTTARWLRRHARDAERIRGLLGEDCFYAALAAVDTRTSLFLCCVWGIGRDQISVAEARAEVGIPLGSGNEYRMALGALLLAAAA